MNFKGDINEAFGPLETYVNENNYPFDETMSEYMYMGDEDDIYYYKHIMDRSYLKINESGKKL